MTSGRCNQPGPCDQGCVCIAHPGAHADHACRHRTWPNENWVGLTVEEALKPEGQRRAEKKQSVNDIAKRARDRARGTGVPPEAEEAWAEDPWTIEAYRVLSDYCRTSEDTFTTPEHIWPLLRTPREMRMMTVPVNQAIRAGLIVEVDAVRLKGIYRTGDGTEFKLNKLVPVYRPARVMARTGVLRDFG